MRALVMTQPSASSDATEVRDIVAPRPGRNEVAIEVTHAGINFIDVMARRGDPGYASAWPYVPGMEVSGVVSELGDDVVGLTVGQRVVALTQGGGLAETAIANSALVAELPGALPGATAAAAPLTLTTALLLLVEVARIAPGETLLMQSAGGGVGGAVAQLARVLASGRRIGVVGQQSKVSAALERGWDVAVPRDSSLVEEVLERVPGGVDVVLDPTGTALLETDLELIAPGGRIVLFGNAAGDPLAPLPDARRLIGGNATIAGLSVTRLAAQAPDRVAAQLRRAVELLDRGLIDIDVIEIASLAAVAAVHDQLAQRTGAGKYVASVI
jgi:NADPH:quinone reductase